MERWHWLLALVIGCGSSANTSSIDSGADSPAQMDSSVDAVEVDAGPGDTGGGDTGADPLYPGYQGAFIAFYRQGGSSQVFAGVFADSMPECTRTVEGACGSVICTVGRDAGTTTPPTAGLITLTGGTFGTGVQVAPIDGFYSYRESPPSIAFSPGDLLGVSAAGGTVPAFSQSITAPGCISLTTPPGDYDAGSEVKLSPSQDLDLAWTGGQAGAVVFAGVGSPLMTVSCSFDAPSGHGTIPQKLLATLTGSNALVFAFGQGNSSMFTAGGLQVALAASCNTVVGAAL